MAARVLRLLPAEAAYPLAALATLLLALGLYFDGWWHATFGRHSFWIPPHVVIYVGVAVMGAALGLRWLVDRREGRTLPVGFRIVALGLGVTILAAPLDELWHRAFGEEPNFTLIALWSPPHLLALLSAVAGGLGLLSVMAREDGARRLPRTMTLVVACVTAYATFVVIPFEPTGIYRVAGVAGAYLITVVLVGLRLLAVALIRRPGVVTGIATLVTPLVILLTLPRIPPSVTSMAPLPWWVLAVAAFGAAAVLDLLLWRRPAGPEDPAVLSRWGLTFALVFSALFYPAANAAARAGLGALDVLAIVIGSPAAAYATGRAAWWAARRLEGRPASRLEPLRPVPSGSTR